MENLLHELTPLVSQYGLIIVFLGMLVEGTTMILVSGVLCYLGILTLGPTFSAALLGAVIGDHIWFILGRKYGQSILNRFPAFEQKSKKVFASVKSNANLIASTSRFIAGGAIIFPLILGLKHYPQKKFTLFDILGDSVWALLGLSLGYILGTAVEQLFGKIERFEHLLLIILVIVFGVWFFKYKKA